VNRFEANESATMSLIDSALAITISLEIWRTAARKVSSACGSRPSVRTMLNEPEPYALVYWSVICDHGK